MGQSAERPVTLPAPTLLGQPVDEDSYQALLRGYGAHLAILLADRYVDPACCGTESRVRAATRSMLVDLDLMDWPPAPEQLDVEPAGEPPRQASTHSR